LNNFFSEKEQSTTFFCQGREAKLVAKSINADGTLNYSGYTNLQTHQVKSFSTSKHMRKQEEDEEEEWEKRFEKEKQIIIIKIPFNKMRMLTH
jgi:hypothetical protein